MRLLHTSDLHLGLSLYGTPMLGYQEQMLDTLCDTVKKYKADGVIIAGDIFDRAIPPSDAVALWSRFTAKLCGEMNVKAFVIAGNHDGGVRLGSCCELLSASGLYISGSLGDSVSCLKSGNTVIHMLPYFTADDVRSFAGCDSIHGHGEAYRTMLDTIKEQLVPDAYNILMTHCFVSGAQTSDSERAIISGGLDSVSSDMFDCFDYTAAGHLHRRQTLGKVHYSGTPLCYSFAEAAQKKTVTLIDTETKEVTDIEIPQPYILRTLRGSMDEITAIGRCDDFIRAEITSGYNGYMSLELLREMFSNLMCVSVEQADDKISGIESSFSGETLTPMQLLERYAADTGLEYDDELAEWFIESVKNASCPADDEKEDDK